MNDCLIWLTESAVVTRKLASRTGSIELNAADTTDFILRHIPSPCSNGMPGLDGDLHDCCWREKFEFLFREPTHTPV
jgi:hypothetical protein